MQFVPLLTIGEPSYEIRAPLTIGEPSYVILYKLVQTRNIK